MTERTDRPRPRTYEKHSPAVWEAIRRGYVDGYSVPQLAERFGVNAAAISWRSREHGWREERAAAEAEARDLSFELIPPRGAPGAASDPDAPSTYSPKEAARAAFARSTRALQEGRPDEAQRWARLANQLNRLAPADPAPSPDPSRAARPGPSLTGRYPIPARLEKSMAPFVEGGAKHRAEVYASARAKQDDPGHYFEDLTPDEAAMLGGERFVPGGNAPTDPDHVDDGLDLFRYYQPGKGTSWEKLTALAARPAPRR